LEDGKAQGIRRGGVCYLYEDKEEEVTPLHQTYFYGGYEEGITRGNCWQTAIASVLDLPLDDVPHFVDIDERGGENWWYFTCNWLWYRGYEIQRLSRHIYTNEYYFVSGKSPRGDFYHVVIYQNGKMVHDPHPDSTGVLTEETFDIIRPRYIRKF
jgi:hypothetical protein